MKVLEQLINTDVSISRINGSCTTFSGGILQKDEDGFFYLEGAITNLAFRSTDVRRVEKLCNDKVHILLL